MFTGLVQDVGVVTKVQHAGAPVTGSKSAGLKMSLETNLALEDLLLGASVSCNGVCLTVTNEVEAATGPKTVEFFLGPETLSKTQFAAIQVGDKINLEPSLRSGSPLGGHQVQGHVDGLATVRGWHQNGEAWELLLELDRQHCHWVMLHGSIAVMGVSLTVAGINEETSCISIMIIPHTLSKTNFGGIKVGQRVEIECDLQIKTIVETCKKFIEPVLKSVLQEKRLAWDAVHSGLKTEQ